MDCNKEEAIRAKEIAERKMESRDFVGARKVALRAQQLCPDLKDISQMILVCDVQCAAQTKVWGNVDDWYSILQVEPTADEAAIKKQYRKFALSLHPDKNQFPGASDAFKFIGEAQKGLLDSQNRKLYDSKYRACGRYQASNSGMQQGSRQPNVRAHPWFQNNFVKNTGSQFMNQQHHQQKQQTQSVPDPNRATFWTVCPYCSVRYQYYKEVINRTLYCQSCKNSFPGYELNAPSGTSGTNSSQPKFSQDRGAVGQGGSAAVPQSNFTGFSSKTPKEGSINCEKLKRDSFPAKVFTSEVNKESNVNDYFQNRNVKIDNNSNKRKESAESSESCSTDSSTDSEEDVINGEDGDNLHRQNGYLSEQNLRRSNRSKQQVSYDEILSDNDEMEKPSKRSKLYESFSANMEEVEGHSIPKQAALDPDKVENSKGNWLNEEKKTEWDNEKVSVSEDDEKSSAPEIYEYPDPDFSDFDKIRKEESFAVGQMWAIYDSLDGMPRFYALIKKVLSPGFKLKITWLEPDPDEEDEIKWVNEGLPASCGKFRHGSTEDSGDHAMFSHMVEHWEKGSRRNICKIYPRRGETWAMFKNWDINWHSSPRSKNKYEFEFVEVLSDFNDSIGVEVTYLGKLKGFACLFCRTMKECKDSELIPAKQVFRFSHKVPSFKMIGEEGKNVPAGSFELDPASLPASPNGIDVCEILNTGPGEKNLTGSFSRSPADILGANGEAKRDASPKQFTEMKARSERNAAVANSVQPNAMSEEKDCLANKARLKRNACPTDTAETKAGYKVNTTMANATVANKASSVKVDLEARSEGTSLQGTAGNKDFQNSSCCSSDSSTKGIVGSPTFASEDCVVPDPDFHNFDAEKTLEQFQVGQIWAMYCDEDALPKYYGMIKHIESPPNFGLHLTWLVPSVPPKGMVKWIDKKMPISCGKFKIGRRKTNKYENTSAFSHQLKVQSIGEKHDYAIVPQKGDVWALYKNWNENIKCSDLENCEYEIAEVLDKNETGITVLVLELVNGFKSVFKPQMEGQSTMTMQISWAELLRFSHQVPAVRLTEEKGGSLRGFWELDTAALPVYLFCLR